MSELGEGEGSMLLASSKYRSGRDASKHFTMHRTSPKTKNYPGQNVLSSAKAKKKCSKPNDRNMLEPCSGANNFKDY